MQDLVGGQVKVSFVGGPNAVPYLANGKLRAYIPGGFEFVEGHHPRLLGGSCERFVRDAASHGYPAEQRSWNQSAYLRQKHEVADQFREAQNWLRQQHY